MDPTTMMVAGVAFIGSTVAQKCADEALAAAWGRIVQVFRKRAQRDPNPSDLVSAGPFGGGSLLESGLMTEAELVFEEMSSLRRARVTGQVLQGAQILWVDDRPSNNEWETATLCAFGAKVCQVAGTDEALSYLSNKQVDLILSDIAREGSNREGVKALPELRRAANEAPLVFYAGTIRPEMGVPVGAFGITNRPDELLHLVLDVLERARM